MKAFFQNLLDYSHFYNLKLIEIFSDAENSKRLSEKSKILLSHILNASSVWNSRILGIPNRLGVWKIFEAEELRKLEDQNYLETQKILKDRKLNEVIAYKNTKGDYYERTIGDIIFHTLNHATYHRGQIASEFRKSGLEPIVSDYIFYRETTFDY
ncbi:DinB family protein [Christiangramia flava]|uniref:DinB family protein n=1 Tax=Christiangramia flava TaxID=1486245 RepID=UPI0009F9433A|nr:DinB family protein [Christiangramia flava]